MLRGIIQLTNQEIEALKPETLSNQLLANKLNVAKTEGSSQIEVSEEEVEHLLDSIDAEKLATDPVLTGIQSKLMQFLSSVRRGE